MAYEGQVNLVHTMPAGAALANLVKGSGVLYKALALDDGLPAANGREAGGILLYGTSEAGGHITLGVQGIMKAVAGGAIAAGRPVTVAASGYITNAVSGSYIVGRALDEAATSGSVFTGAFDFVNPFPMTFSF